MALWILSLICEPVFSDLWLVKWNLICFPIYWYSVLSKIMIIIICRKLRILEEHWLNSRSINFICLFYLTMHIVQQASFTHFNLNVCTFPSTVDVVIEWCFKIPCLSKLFIGLHITFCIDLHLIWSLSYLCRKCLEKAYQASYYNSSFIDAESELQSCKMHFNSNNQNLPYILS